MMLAVRLKIQIKTLMLDYIYALFPVDASYVGRQLESSEGMADSDTKNENCYIER